MGSIQCPKNMIFKLLSETFFNSIILTANNFCVVKSRFGTSFDFLRF